MANCLVTKLKGSVNGDLPIIDTVRIYARLKENVDYSYRWFGVIFPSNDGTIQTKNGTIVDGSGASQGTTKTIKAGVEQQNTILSNTADCCALIKSKYDMTRLELQRDLYMNIDDLSYVPLDSIDITNANYCTGNLYNINENIKTIRIFKGLGDATVSKITGDISRFTQLEHLVADIPLITGRLNSTDLKYVAIESSNIKTSFNELNNLTSLTALYVDSSNLEQIENISNLSALKEITHLRLHGDKVSGKIEDLLEGLLNNGKTVNIEYLSLFETNVTLNNIWHYFLFENNVYTVEFGVNTIDLKNNGNVVAHYNGSAWTYA